MYFISQFIEIHHLNQIPILDNFSTWAKDDLTMLKNGSIIHINGKDYNVTELQDHSKHIEIDGYVYKIFESHYQCKYTAQERFLSGITAIWTLGLALAISAIYDRIFTPYKYKFFIVKQLPNEAKVSLHVDYRYPLFNGKPINVNSRLLNKMSTSPLWNLESVKTVWNLIHSNTLTIASDIEKLTIREKLLQPFMKKEDPSIIFNALNFFFDKGLRLDRQMLGKLQLTYYRQWTRYDSEKNIEVSLNSLLILDFLKKFHSPNPPKMNFDQQRILNILINDGKSVLLDFYKCEKDEIERIAHEDENPEFSILLDNGQSIQLDCYFIDFVIKTLQEIV